MHYQGKELNMATKAKKKSLYQQFKASKPQFYEGKKLTRMDVVTITSLYKMVRMLQGALRDYQEK